MKTMTAALVAALMTGWLNSTDAGADETGEVSFELPVESVKLDALGNVERVTFSNGAYIDGAPLDPKDLQGRAVGGVRRLPFYIMKIADPEDPDNPRIVVVGDSGLTLPAELPSEQGALISVYPDTIGVSVEGTATLICQPGTCPAGFRCVPCPVMSILFPMLVGSFDAETNESKIDVLMSEVPVGLP